MTRSTPLRVKLVAAVVALAALALLVTGLSATRVLHGYLQARVDSQLTAAARALLRPNDGRLLSGRRGGPRFDELSAYYVRVTAADGTLLYEPTVLAPERQATPALPAAGATPAGLFTVADRTGQSRFRALAIGLDGGGTAVVALDLRDVDSTTRRLTLIELVVGLIVLAVLAGLGYLVVGSSLRPLVEVETTAEAIAAGDLSRRVPESDPRTEVGRLSRALNTMLEQIETAFQERAASEQQARRSEERMRRFVADASHELRTPLTSIRGFAELHRQGALPATADVDRAMLRVEDEAARMGLLVDDLLLLARLDQQRPLEQQPVDLLELASAAVHAASPSAEVQLVAASPDVAPVVTGDPQRLRQVFGNLVTNALVHGAPPVVVRIGTSYGEAVVEVVDHGRGLPVDDRARAFERFFRADVSRTRASGGTGLGLSIVASIVRAHTGTVELDETPGGGTTVRVRLPLAAPYGPSSSALP